MQTSLPNTTPLLFELNESNYLPENWHHLTGKEFPIDDLYFGEESDTDTTAVN